MAIKSQGALVRVSSAEAATKVITGITAASPPVVSSTSHGYVAGDIVRIANVVGMTEVNGRAFVVGVVAAGTFELKGIDGTGYTAYGSGGDSYKQTMISISQVTGFSKSGGEADTIDVTHLLSTGKEKLLGLLNPGTYTMPVNMVDADAGQKRVRALQYSGAVSAFALTDSAGLVQAMLALVKSFDWDNTTNDAKRGSFVLEATGLEAYFA